MSALPADLATAPPAGDSAALTQRSRLWSAPLAALRLVVGSVLIATPFTAVLVLGWLMRVMRRETVLAALRYCGAGSRKAARQRLSAVPELREHMYWPACLRVDGLKKEAGPAADCLASSVVCGKISYSDCPRF